jgi:organic radical activating enzyme
MKLTVNEIFYSLQGEGNRAGEAAIFIRLAGCNLQCPFCDTAFDTGTVMQAIKIAKQIAGYPSRRIIWTGGEPTLQLTGEITGFFKRYACQQSIETNGTRPVPPFIDYITCSPKGNYDEIKRLNPRVNEIRLPVKDGDRLPPVNCLPAADTYYISPIFTADPATTAANIRHCVQLAKTNPFWRLSVQVHKLIGIE